MTHPIKSPKKLIEVALPLDAINAAAVRDRRVTGRNRREITPVARRYERVCFTKEAVRLVAQL